MVCSLSTSKEYGHYKGMGKADLDTIDEAVACTL